MENPRSGKVSIRDCVFSVNGRRDEISTSPPCKALASPRMLRSTDVANRSTATMAPTPRARHRNKNANLDQELLVSRQANLKKTVNIGIRRKTARLGYGSLRPDGRHAKSKCGRPVWRVRHHVSPALGCFHVPGVIAITTQ